MPKPSASANDRFYAQYKAECLDVDAYIRFATSPWRERGAQELAAASERFTRELIQPAIEDSARALLRRHVEAGDRVAIVTATNEFITRPIAMLFGVDELIATELQRDAAGRVTGAVLGVPAYREGKVTRVQQWLAQQGLACDGLRAHHVLQRFHQRPAAARARQPPGGDQPGPRARTHRTSSAAGPSSGSLHDQEIHRPSARQGRRSVEAGGATGQARRGRRGRTRHRPEPAGRTRGARGAHAQGGRARGLHRRRRGARPAGRAATEGFRRRHQRHARAGEGAVPPCLHHRPALPHRARHLRPRPRPRGDRGLDLPRAARLGGGRSGQRQREDLEAGAQRQVACGRCSGPRAARQRLGPADRGCRTARLQRQRAVLRPDRTGRRRLPPWLQGREEARAAHDRRPGCALPRRPGAHHPRGALRRQAGLRHRPGDAARRSRRWPRCWPTCRPRACSTR